MAGINVEKMKSLTICLGNSCKSIGSGLLLKLAETELDCRINETSPEAIQLEPHQCIGNCNYGPSIKVNNYIFSQMAETELKAIIDALKSDNKQFLASIFSAAQIDLGGQLLTQAKQ